MDGLVFSTEEKANMFDQIAGHFYSRNFGQTSKTDLEVLMFNFYLRQMERTHPHALNLDYLISKELGITQQRVRNLRVKSQLLYPVFLSWRDALSRLLEHARYDEDSHIIRMNIPDPNLYLEIQNFIEEKGGYIEVQLNSKLLQIRVEYFVELIVSLEEQEDKREQLLTEIRNHIKTYQKQNLTLDKRGIGHALIRQKADIISLLANLATLASATKPLLETLSTIIGG